MKKCKFKISKHEEKCVKNFTIFCRKETSLNYIQKMYFKNSFEIPFNNCLT